MSTIETLFSKTFSAAPSTYVQVPGRVNLIGEHTDYNGGMVLPTVIDRLISVAIGPSVSGGEQFYSEGYGLAPDMETSTQTDPDNWWSYPAGVLAWARAQGNDIPSLAIAFHSTLPEGSGLSSSAAMTVAVLKALRAAELLALDDVAIAQAAQAVENDYVGVPCGIMDQMAVSVGRPGDALALDTGTLDFEHAPLPDSHDFAVIHSGVTRKLTDGRYKDRRVECETAAAQLGIAELCKMEDADMARLAELPDPLARRARHAVTEHRRVKAAVSALKDDDLDQFGKLMNESHTSYSRDFEASTPEIDALVAFAQESGAKGARLTGGGFGGCIVACIEKDKRAAWQDGLMAQFPNIRVIC